MEYTAQNLEYAVSVFYNGEQEDRAKAHTWLTAAQRVPQAWNFVWELLQPSKGTEIQFYAATTLHTKILRCWNEIPPENYPELKDKLLQAVIGYSKGPKIVTNRLCISLAAFILQQGSTDLAEILRPLSIAENTSLLLEVLTVIPEEYNSMTMGTTLRSRNRAALNQACCMVLDDMLRYLQSVYNDYSTEPPSEDTVQSWTSAATCAASWLSLGGEDAVDCATTLPERAPLCRALNTAVHIICTWNEAVSDSALEACEACLAAVRAAGTAGGAARHSAAARALLAELAALAEPLFAAHDSPNSLNEELLSALITCCVSVSECHAGVLVLAAEGAGEATEAETLGARTLLRLLLAAQAAPGHYPLHETRSNLVFGLWYTLQDEILHAMDSTRKINPLWQDVFTQLLMALVKKSEMPPEMDLSRDDEELLRCYRQDIADVVMYCFSVLGTTCWSLVESAYLSATSATQREAALHVFMSLADAAPHEHAPPALAALLQHALRRAADTESPDQRLLHTALDCLGAYATWLSSLESPEGAALSRECMRAAGAALQRCPAPAALALRKLCVDCTEPAAALVADIVQVAQNASVGVGSSDAWTRRQLLSAAGAALAASALPHAAPLLRGLASRLAIDLTAQARNGGKCHAADCVSLMGALSPRSALALQLFQELLPALRLLLNNKNPLLLQPMFQILKQTIGAVMNDIMPIVEDVAELIIAGFEKEPCPVGLDVIKLFTVLVGAEWGGAARVVRAGVVASARLVAPPAAPDLAEALFSVLAALTKKQPRVVDWIDDLLTDLVDLACGWVRAWEARAAAAACCWLAALAQRRPAALLRHAPRLTHTALSCIGGATPRNQMEPLAELLLALNRAQWPAAGSVGAGEAGGAGAGEAGGAGAGEAGGAGGEARELGAWLRVALAHAGFPSAHATDAHKQKFIQAVLREKNSKRRLLETVQEFSLACRGLIGTEYARQSIASKQMVA